MCPFVPLSGNERLCATWRPPGQTGRIDPSGEGHRTGSNLGRSLNDPLVHISGKKRWTRTSTPIKRPSELTSHAYFIIVEGSGPTRFRYAGLQCASLPFPPFPHTATPPGRIHGPPATGCAKLSSNVLAARIEGAAFLDLYAGSGAWASRRSAAARRGWSCREGSGGAQGSRRQSGEAGAERGFRIHAAAVGAALRKMPAAFDPSAEETSTWSFSIRPGMRQGSTRPRWACWAVRRPDCLPLALW